MFDEPFSSLDGQTHGQLRDELLSFLRAFAVPAVFVTHDHTDARTLADKIVVLCRGAMLQHGPASEILQKPVSSAVARFMGVENILDGWITEIIDGNATVAVGTRVLRAQAPGRWAGAPMSVRLGIRAEDVTLCSPHSAVPPLCTNRLEGCVIGLRALGPLVTVQIDCGFLLNAYLVGPGARKLNLGVGSTVAAEIAAGTIQVMMD